MFNLDKDKVKSANLFLGGLALGTAGIRLLTSKDAKKFYANVVAASLRAKDNVLNTAEMVQSNAEDILAKAKDINEEREDNFFEEDDAEVKKSNAKKGASK